MEFTIWDSTLGCSVPLCVSKVSLKYLIIWVNQKGCERHLFIAETCGKFTKKKINFLLIQYFMVKDWILVTYNGMDISEIIPFLVTHSSNCHLHKFCFKYPEKKTSLSTVTWMLIPTKVATKLPSPFIIDP